MLLFILIFSLGILLILNYYIFEKSLSTPAFLFNAGFFLCALNLSNFIKLWKVDIHYITYLIIVGGSIFVSWGAFLSHKMHNKNKVILQEIKVFNPISIKRLKLIVIFQLIINILRIHFINNYYGMGSLAQNLFAHTFALKFGSDAMQYPTGFGFLSFLSNNIGYIVAFLLPIYSTERNNYKKQKFWLTVNFIVCVVSSLLSSGRTQMLTFIATYGTFYFILLKKNNKSLNYKLLLKWGLTIFAFLTFFQQLGYLIGRSKGEETVHSTIGIYCGAQIQNLDDCIKYKLVETDTRRGEITFYSFYSYLENILNIDILNSEAKEFLPFNSRNGYNLGNVYTTFQAYYLDFGILGTFIICFFIGYITHYLYLQAKQKTDYETGIISIYNYLYGIYAPTIFLSFFSESFFTTTTALINIRFWIAYICLFYIFYGRLPWKKTKFNNL